MLLLIEMHTEKCYNYIWVLSSGDAFTPKYDIEEG